MAITLQTIPEKKTKNGKYTATQRSLEVTLRFDVTGGSGSMTTGKLNNMLHAIVERSRSAVEEQNVDVAAVEGTWAWVYGPYFKGMIDNSY